MGGPTDDATLGGSNAGSLRPYCYDVVGIFSGSFGLSIAAQNSVKSLTESGRDVRKIAVERASHRVARGGATSPAVSPDARVTLFHVNPLDIAAQARRWRGAVHPDAPLACVPFWELPLLPQSWVPLLSAMHVVLAPTRFIQSACATAMPWQRVLHYPQGVFLPEARPVRETWGLSREATVFVISFDIGSDIERKNPWDAVDKDEAMAGRAGVRVPDGRTPGPSRI